MKYLTILLLILTGCQNTDDPRCLDGYLVYSKEAFMGFCLITYQSMDGIRGVHCWDGPQQGSGVMADLTLREGFVMQTSCYNVLSKEKDKK
jgi:hypothetical protein